MGYYMTPAHNKDWNTDGCVCERKIIPRKENGKYAERLEGLEEFTTKVAKELLEKYPDVDYFDLKFCFDSNFGYTYSREMARATKEK